MDCKRFGGEGIPMSDKELLWKAYLAGFKRSGEGWNGEYPWWNGEEEREHMKDVLRNTTHAQPCFEDWYAQEVEDE